ncbi:hypothetical protein [Demequina aestuarii]|uniref:hypothetical protein n=1 Tax=Demequina aestuarii TaxID=327095 RepID=UPI0007857297|nr:hypothetical protein [Demequina aestuarii]
MLHEANSLRGAVGEEDLLDEIAGAAQRVAEVDPGFGSTLRESIVEVGAQDCLVIAASVAARDGIRGWLSDLGVIVVTASEVRTTSSVVEQSYVVGPPRFYAHPVVAAPASYGVTFLVPEWFGDRSLPHSVLSDYAEGAVKVSARIFDVGERLAEYHPPPQDDDAAEAETALLPRPSWSSGLHAVVEVGQDAVNARRVVLAGELAMWLDSGKIRSFDPRQPPGERVTYVEVDSVGPGTYLLLRPGATEHQALVDIALGELGARGAGIAESQREWKARLADRLRTRDLVMVTRSLRDDGVKAVAQVRAWTDPALIRPQREMDFRLLLSWLGLSHEPYVENAAALHRAILRASVRLREELEHAVSAADVTSLERDGTLELEAPMVGVSAMLATRVLAVSPFTRRVARHEVRVPEPDRSGRWLE